MLFLFLLTNVLIVSRFGKKRLLNALNVNVHSEMFCPRSTSNLATSWVGGVMARRYAGCVCLHFFTSYSFYFMTVPVVIESPNTLCVHLAFLIPK